ncbi:hypothetical protein [Algibacter mikhailovii]|uniref:Uncharacterized protein n=1 Tax=Algibacter mikhailovii TaxID=425498 RepID=A0A918QW07_9FLAO|nr:hypothetical protein [Algibacter mikhailovii]GGZ72452.1 hypothetical protein GCM10007028_06840 [Algibacter mikhailovii]
MTKANLFYLKITRNLTILKELIVQERYVELNNNYSYLLNFSEYHDLSSAVKFNLEALSNKIIEKEFGTCIISIDKINKVLNKRIYEFECHRNWMSLSNTTDDNIKFCSECAKNVFKVNSIAEYEKRSILGQCVFYTEPVKLVDNTNSCTITEIHEGLLGLPLGINDIHETDSELPFKS